MNLDYAKLLPLAILGLFLLAIAISKPELGLSALIIVVYTNLSDVLITRFGFPSITQPLMGLLVIVIIARRFIFQDNLEGWSQLAVLLGIYMFLGYLSIFYASDSELVKDTLLYYLKNAVIGLVVIFLLQKKIHLKWAIWSLLGAGIFLGTISVYQVFTGNYGDTFWGFGPAAEAVAEGFRLRGSISDPNYYAQIMVALLPFAIERFLHEKKLVMRLLSAWAIFVFLFAIYHTGSRGGFLALLVVGFLIFASLPSRPYAGILLFGVLLLASYQYVPAQYTERISTLLQLVPGSRTSAKLDASLQDRASANIIGWTMFTDHPIFGIGVGNYNADFDNYARRLGLSHQARSAHNLYLEIAAERGLLGLLSFIAIIYFTIRILQRTKRSFKIKNFTEMASICDALTASLVGYLVASAFLHDAYIRYFWLLVGIAWSVPQVLTSLTSEQAAEDRLDSLRMVFNE